MKRLFAVVVIPVLIMSCSHVKVVSSVDQINREIAGEEVIVTMKWGNRLAGKDLFIRPDSSTWIEPSSLSRVSALTDNIVKIEKIKRMRGSFEALGLFSAAAIIAGSFGALGDYLNPQWMSDLIALKTFLNIAASGTAAGVLIGMPIGYCNGSKEVYYLPKTELKEASK
jgi:hypothetical protein